jgi:hypothetical protein
MGLIVAMFINQTVSVVLDFYSEWLAYVKYSESNDRALSVLVGTEETPLAVLNIIAVENLILTIKLGIADSIMVSSLLIVINSFDIDSIILQVWRCWIICDRSWKATCVPLILTIGTIGPPAPSSFKTVLTLTFSDWHHDFRLISHTSLDSCKHWQCCAGFFIGFVCWHHDYLYYHHCRPDSYGTFASWSLPTTKSSSN